MAEHDSREERLGRIQRWADNLRDVLKEGDELVVRCYDDAVHVEETYSSRFQADHPRLWGRLASLDAQMETGCGLYVAAVVGVAAVGFAIHRQWGEDWLGGDVNETLDAWWFYVLLLGLAIFVATQIYDWQERLAYRRGRDELAALMAAEHLERDTLLPLLIDAPNLDRVVKQLKLDRGPFPGAPKLGTPELGPYEEAP